ncbi:MAG: hypothetical protein ACI9UK_002093 [Candidatus Krumholzibacteriia bacterium]|jgi:hypothetical protein
MNCIDRALRIVILSPVLVGLLSMPVWAGGEAVPARAITVSPVILELTGPMADAQAEISSMAWKGDTLAILPQDPTIFAEEGKLGFFVIDRSRIIAAIDQTNTEPILPREVKCLSPEMSELIMGYDGFEALGLAGNRCFFTIEAEPDSAMASYLLSGVFDVVNHEIVLDVSRFSKIPMGVNIPNIAEEAIVIDGDQVITIAEANGKNVNPRPAANVFNVNGEFQSILPMPQIEYRVTDATAIDKEGRFWVINYYYPPEHDKLDPAPDPETAQYGDGEVFDPDRCVERLLELRIVRTCLGGDWIERTDTPPINLELSDTGDCRNWEALVRLEGRGFLLMTDKYPSTLLAFVPYQPTED